MKTSPEDSVARPTYHEGMRKLQDRYDTRRLADRLVEVLDHGGVHRDEARDPFDRDPAVTRCAWHRGVDLRDHRPRGQRGGLEHRPGSHRVHGDRLLGEDVLARLDCRPDVLRAEYPAVYEQLRQFYRQDPLR